LTGKGENGDKLKGFDLGTDDYLVKPFDPNELMARIKAVLRRANPMLAFFLFSICLPNWK
jgi:DNA-binding response OmpR family regulator